MPIITPGTGTRCQSITDIIMSVALEQTALSHILNAEGEKIQKVVAEAKTTEEMLAVNRSVESMVQSITQLETVLQEKLKLFENCLCKDCEECSKARVSVFNSSGVAMEKPGNVFSLTVAPSQSTTINTSPLSTITVISLAERFTLVGNELVAPAQLEPLVAYTSSFYIGDGSCKFKIEINMTYINS